MVLTIYFFLCRLLQFSFKNVSSFEKFKTGRMLRRKNSTEEYKAGHPLHKNSFIAFTDLFESEKLISQNISF